jgi:hypothetical protein
MKKPIATSRVIRWLLLLKEFDIILIAKPDRDNIFAYFLSRVTNEGDVVPVEDNFPEEHLFTISTHTLWYEYIANYLIEGELPSHLSS